MLLILIGVVFVISSVLTGKNHRWWNVIPCLVPAAVKEDTSFVLWSGSGWGVDMLSVLCPGQLPHFIGDKSFTASLILQKANIPPDYSHGQLTCLHWENLAWGQCDIGTNTNHDISKVRSLWSLPAGALQDKNTSSVVLCYRMIQEGQQPSPSSFRPQLSSDKGTKLAPASAHVRRPGCAASLAHFLEQDVCMCSLSDWLVLTLESRDQSRGLWKMNCLGQNGIKANFYLFRVQGWCWTHFCHGYHCWSETMFFKILHEVVVQIDLVSELDLKGCAILAATTITWNSRKKNEVSSSYRRQKEPSPYCPQHSGSFSLPCSGKGCELKSAPDAAAIPAKLPACGKATQEIQTRDQF